MSANVVKPVPHANIMSRKKRNLRLASVAISVFCLIVFSVAQEIVQPNLFSSQPVYAQISRQQDVGKQVYQQVPYLPLENKYSNKETGQVDPNNTLVSRLIRYHTYTKGRAPNYRLDWKLTLADYLGANDVMEEGRYPGFDTLRQNPMEGDRAAIGRLNREQRDVLVQSLVNIFSKATPETNSNTAPQSTTPQQGASPVPTQPQGGGAELLKP